MKSFQKLVNRLDEVVNFHSNLVSGVCVVCLLVCVRACVRVWVCGCVRCAYCVFLRLHGLC